MGFKALQKSDWVNVLIAIPAGIIAALVTIGFRLAISGINGLMFTDGSDITRAFREYPLLAWPLITTVGGVVAGFILYWAMRHESRNGKMPDYLDVIDQRLPGIPVVSTLLRSLSSLASIASGGSIGREGAMVQLSALSGSLLGRFSRFSTLHQSDVIAMAAAGGLAAVYHAPFAGALFVAEIAFGVTAVQRLIPLFISASVAVLTVRSLTHYAPLYLYSSAVFSPTPSAIITVLAIGAITGILGPLFIASIDKVRKTLQPISHPALRLGLGGLAVGLVAMVSPLVLGNGFEVIDLILNNGNLHTSLLLLLVLKIVATAITVGSGAVGGLFTPSLLIGAAGGALVCTCLQWMGLDPGPMGLYAAIGMSALLAATSHAPLMSIMMAFEMTLNSSLLFPLMLATAISYVVASRFKASGTYPVLTRHNARFAAKSDFENGTVAELMCPCSKMYIDATLAEVVSEGLKQRTRFVYVVDREERFLGVVPTNVLASGIIDGTLNKESSIDAYIEHEFIVLYQQSSYEQAWATFSSSPLERLPVLENAQSRRLLGVITKAALLSKAKDFL
ncbi:chloride channel protein [Rouxiella silvae]|uniref:Chloride channel protein n=1 Tax=Rouxiella silvae TaxID=1646373 RepID=A0AA40X315_9GAMM|nr:chloride channel protein [Rouxiella silvae]MBF6637736.1 chloride channel protein [Rouxiella silvae]ORJ19242.1 chloride channel protein [Rouxiella silvae]